MWFFIVSLYVSLSDDEDDLSTVTPLLVASYMLCYTPFVVSEVTHALTPLHLTSRSKEKHIRIQTDLKATDRAHAFPTIDCLCFFPLTHQLILLGRMDLSPAPDWLRTLSSVMSYLDCSLNPLIYCSHQDFREAGLALLWTKRKLSSDPVLTAITQHDL